jgi:hypothetical protein
MEGDPKENEPGGSTLVPAGFERKGLPRSPAPVRDLQSNVVQTSEPGVPPTAAKPDEETYYSEEEEKNLVMDMDDQTSDDCTPIRVSIKETKGDASKVGGEATTSGQFGTEVYVDLISPEDNRPFTLVESASKKKKQTRELRKRTFLERQSPPDDSDKGKLLVMADNVRDLNEKAVQMIVKNTQKDLKEALPNVQEVIRALRRALKNHLDIWSNTVRRVADLERSEWKTARLVLLPKPGRPPSLPSAYRPICLLDGVAKVAENVIASRITAEIEEKQMLTDDQYRFRKGRSTLSAIKRVVEAAEEEILKGQSKSRQITAVLAIDVRNAFNTIPWEVINRALERYGMSRYLRKVVANYLEGRTITYGGVTHKMAMGVPQGSVLGPILWNLGYNDVFNVKLMGGVTLIGYADDIAAIVKGRSGDEVKAKAAVTLATVDEWLADHGLAMAPEKTELLAASGRKKHDDIDFDYKGHSITAQKTLKYLGVMLDNSFTGGAHVKMVTAKVDRTVKALLRMMPRQRGAREAKRRLLASVADSTVLYAAPVWAKAMKVQKNVRKLHSLQRRLAMRICRSYRTISMEASQILARTVTWGLKAQ